MKHLTPLIPALSLLISFAVYWHRDDIAEYFNPPDKNIPIISFPEEDDSITRTTNTVTNSSIPLQEVREVFLSKTEANITEAIDKKFSDPASPGEIIENRKFILEQTKTSPEKNVFWAADLPLTLQNNSSVLKIYLRLFQENSLGEDNLPTSTACWSLLIKNQNKQISSQFSCDGFKQESKKYFVIEDHLQITENPENTIALAIEVPSQNSLKTNIFFITKEMNWSNNTVQWLSITKDIYLQALQ